MPLSLQASHPSLIIRRSAFERVGLLRSAIDQRLGLTDEEFRVEGNVIVAGPILDVDAMQGLIADLELSGLVYFDDFFELSGNWPEWLKVYVGET